MKVCALAEMQIPRIKRKIPNNSFLKNTCMKLTILYITKSEDEDTGDMNVYFIENINDNIISKVLPQLLLNAKQYNVTIQENHVKNFLQNLTADTNNNKILTIIKNSSLPLMHPNVPPVTILKREESSSPSKRLSSLRDTTTHTEVTEPEREGGRGEREGIRGGKEVEKVRKGK